MLKLASENGKVFVVNNTHSSSESVSKCQNQKKMVFQNRFEVLKKGFGLNFGVLRKSRNGSSDLGATPKFKFQKDPFIFFKLKPIPCIDTSLSIGGRTHRA